MSLDIGFTKPVRVSLSQLQFPKPLRRLSVAGTPDHKFVALLLILGETWTEKRAERLSWALRKEPIDRVREGGETFNRGRRVDTDRIVKYLYHVLSTR